VSATFDPNLSTTRDRVRLEIGDTNVSVEYMLEDETIDALLSAYSNDLFMTCAACCRYIMNAKAHLGEAIGTEGATRDHALAHWREMERRFRARGEQETIVHSEFVEVGWNDAVEAIRIMNEELR